MILFLGRIFFKTGQFKQLSSIITFCLGYLGKTGVNDNVWLGGNDISKEGVWKWTDGSLGKI